MAEHVLIFGAGPLVPPLLREIAPDVVTTVMCHLNVVTRLKDPKLNARVVALPFTSDDDQWVALARAIDAAQPVTRIAIGGEYDQERGSAVAAALGLPWHSPEVMRRVMDKNAMRERLRESGVEETPATIALDADDVRKFAAAHGYPCIVKPVGGTASIGVTVVRDDRDVDLAFGRAASPPDYVRLSRPSVLVESFFTGVEYSVEAFSEDGDHVVLAITRKFTDPTFMVELGHVLPAPLSVHDSERIGAYVAEVLDALGITFGPTHTEIVLTDDGPRVVETHVRVGGDDIFNMVADGVGVDMIRFQARQVLGEKVLPEIRQIIECPDRTPRYEAIWFASAPATGELVEVTGAQPTDDLPDVETVVLASPGTVLNGLDSSFARLAQARAHRSDPTEALAAAQAAIGRIQFLTKVTIAPPTDPAAFGL
jgi:carbamoylphosphate synthase large subunit